MSARGQRFPERERPARLALAEPQQERAELARAEPRARRGAPARLPRGRLSAASLAGLVLLAGCSGDSDEARPAEPTGAEASAPDGASRAPAAAGSAPEVWFEDATADSGLAFHHDAGVTAEKHLPETMGGGAALFDANGDGRLDAYFVQSGPMPVGAHAARTADMPPNQLFLGAGGGRFRDATASAGAAAHRGYGMGVAAGDVDGDGAVDLYVTCFGPDTLLRGGGDGSFADATAEAGLADARWTAGPVFFDADADGDLDLYVTGYVEIDVDDPAWCGDRRPGWRSYCHPDAYAGLADRFWRNDGEGGFADATEGAGLADNRGKGLGAIASDLDLDGDLDLYVANDSTENKLWRNAGDGTFADDTLFTGTGVNRAGATEAGMGLATGDIDGDGDLDLFVTNFDDESNTLYRNDGEGFFSDATIAAGLDAPSRLPVGFGCVLEDFDLDGDVDLAVANGHIIDNIHLYHDGKTWRQAAQLFVNEGGRFAESRELAGALGATPFVGRGLYVGDLDGDGDPDLLLTQCGGPAVALRNALDRGPARIVRGLAPGTPLRARGPGGAELLRQAGGAVSYFGRGEEAVFLPAAATEVRVLDPNGRWRPADR
ncbi:MAG: VCBS repeat-containing protein [Planctomycetota bacterium]